jgi:hypothetical protein
MHLTFRNSRISCWFQAELCTGTKVLAFRSKTSLRLGLEMGKLISYQIRMVTIHLN